jgi:hypothetical protein
MPVPTCATMALLSGPGLALQTAVGRRTRDRVRLRFVLVREMDARDADLHVDDARPVGYGMGKLELVEHDGEGKLQFEQRPFVVMADRSNVDLGTTDRATTHTSSVSGSLLTGAPPRVEP